LTTPTAWPTWQPEPQVHLHSAVAIAEEFIPQQPIFPDVGLYNTAPYIGY